MQDERNWKSIVKEKFLLIRDHFADHLGMASTIGNDIIANNFWLFFMEENKSCIVCQRENG
ncbi:hypothetical protein EDM52_15675 [Brevibacillus invocatus]|uniref:Uncharacterized protein n=1 Tax=Brevibacillus invocatus TaxID=173959 RepID=A0A3M8C6D7_9BACL|nr:hypothetical protein EDM52_15675 [Brevibacillus invocatus]